MTVDVRNVSDGTRVDFAELARFCCDLCRIGISTREKQNVDTGNYNRGVNGTLLAVVGVRDCHRTTD